MDIYTIKHVANTLEVSISTVRKYALLLEEKGFKISRNENNIRLFYDADMMALRELIKRSTNGEKLSDIAKDIAIKQIRIEDENDNPPAPNDAAAIREMTRAIERLTEKVDKLEQENEETRRAFMMALRKIETLSAEPTATIEVRNEDDPTDERLKTTAEKRGFFSRFFARK